MFGIGGGEILLIALVAVVLFGTDDLPKNMKKFVNFWRDFRGVTNDLQRGWMDVRDQVTRDIMMERSSAHRAHESDAKNSTSEESSGPSSLEESLAEAEQLSSESTSDDGKPVDAEEAHAGPFVPVPRSAVGSLPRESTFEERIEPLPAQVTPSEDPDKST
jgi:Sec-independent protein translocase protein TatA